MQKMSQEKYCFSGSYRRLQIKTVYTVWWHKWYAFCHFAVCTYSWGLKGILFLWSNCDDVWSWKTVIAWVWAGLMQFLWSLNFRPLWLQFGWHKLEIICLLPLCYLHRWYSSKRHVTSFYVITVQCHFKAKSVGYCQFKAKSVGQQLVAYYSYQQAAAAILQLEATTSFWLQQSAVAATGNHPQCDCIPLVYLRLWESWSKVGKLSFENPDEYSASRPCSWFITLLVQCHCVQLREMIFIYSIGSQWLLVYFFIIWGNFNVVTLHLFSTSAAFAKGVSTSR